MKRSKRYKQIAAQIEAEKQYTLEEALELLKNGATKFDGSVELHIRLGIDPKKSDQIVRGTLSLPHGTGKTKRVAAFVGPENEAAAKDAGADVIGTEEVIAEIKKTGKCDFDVAVATPDMMKKLGPIAKTLGQQGMMPNPKTETVGPDIAKMVKEHKAGKVAFRNDDGGNVHFLVGRLSFDAKNVIENINAVVDAIQKAKPDESKGTYIKSVTMAASMSPGVPVTLAQA